MTDEQRAAEALAGDDMAWCPCCEGIVPRSEDKPWNWMCWHCWYGDNKLQAFFAAHRLRIIELTDDWPCCRAGAEIAMWKWRRNDR